MPAVTFPVEALTATWGKTPGNKHRRSATHPSKTAMVGLVANAMGRDYTDPVDDLMELDFAVRIDRKGTIIADYHTVGNATGMAAIPSDNNRGIPLVKTPWTPQQMGVHQPVKNPDYTRSVKGLSRPKTVPANPKQIMDEYLVDWGFTVAFSGDETIIAAVATALQTPARPLFAGRKNNPLTTPPTPTITDSHSALDALKTTPPIRRRDTGPLTVWATTQPGETGTIPTDNPTVVKTSRGYARLESRHLVDPHPHTAEGS